MPVSYQSLPCPELTIALDFCAGEPAPNHAELPSTPGVFVLEDATGGTLALMATANLRRMIKSKLQPRAETAAPTRRIDYRSLTRRILAAPVGSAFEADWAYLQLARHRLSATYRSLLDRWQAWFIQCDPDAAFPQFVKTAHPRFESAASDVTIGPFPDKHAAGRYIEMLQDAFDLCRYHHILLQAPKATACAYKEMGRCPAPCDGSISMAEYRHKIREAIDFTCAPHAEWRAKTEQTMRSASARLRFEEAQRLRELLDRTAPATRAEFARVDRLENFAFVAVTPREPGHTQPASAAKIFFICGGWIEPFIVHDDSSIDRALREIRGRAKPPAAFSEAGVENIGMVCWHLFRPRAARGQSAVFLHVNDELDASAISAAIPKLQRQTDASGDAEDAVPDRETDNLANAGDQA